MVMNLPTILTLLRVLLIPVLIWVMVTPFTANNYWAAFVFYIIGVSDWLDGYLARAWDQSSRFGAFLDPVADKLCISSVLVVLVMMYPSIEIAIPTAIIIAREIFVSGLREWMADLGLRDAVAVGIGGKIKTAAQGFAIFFMLLNYELYGLELFDAGLWCLWLATALSLWSMAQYTAAGWPHLTAKDSPEAK